MFASTGMRELLLWSRKHPDGDVVDVDDGDVVDVDDVDDVDDVTSFSALDVVEMGVPKRGINGRILRT